MTEWLPLQSSLLLPLCNELEITVNELLSGERVSEEYYRKKAEENMVNLVKEAQENKKKIIISVMVALLASIVAIPLFVLAGVLSMESWLRIFLIIWGLCILVIGIVIACILDRDAGAFAVYRGNYCIACFMSCCLVSYFVNIVSKGGTDLWIRKKLVDF